jgi:hypothetical protein
VPNKALQLTANPPLRLYAVEPGRYAARVAAVSPVPTHGPVNKDLHRPQPKLCWTTDQSAIPDRHLLDSRAKRQKAIGECDER